MQEARAKSSDCLLCYWVDEFLSNTRRNTGTTYVTSLEVLSSLLKWERWSSVQERIFPSHTFYFEGANGCQIHDARLQFGRLGIPPGFAGPETLRTFYYVRYECVRTKECAWLRMIHTYVQSRYLEIFTRKSVQFFQGTWSLTVVTISQDLREEEEASKKKVDSTEPVSNYYVGRWTAWWIRW